MEITPALIVDDSMMIVKIIKKALLANEIKGFNFNEKNIYTASDGMEAFDVMGQGHNIQLIVSDINMPNLNGDEFIEILQDTGKLKELDVVFVTSSSTKLVLSNSMKEETLGVVYKPFRYDSFNEEMNLLQRKKELMNIETQQVKENQVEQKKFIEKVCFMYLEELNFEVKADIFSVLIDETFTNENVNESEFAEIIYSTLSTYMFEEENNHKVNNKKISCILKSFEKKAVIKEKRFDFIAGFEERIRYVNSHELELKEILLELTTSLLDKISMALSKVKKFPKLSTKLYSPYFDFIVEEFIKIDCDFMDNNLQKLIFEQKESEQFHKWIYDFLDNSELVEKVEIVSKSQELKSAVLKRLNIAYKQNFLLSQHYCGGIEFHLFRKAKDSVEIYNYFKRNMSNTIPNSSRFLFHKEKISKKDRDSYIPFEKQKVVIMSNDLKVLEVFKEIVNVPFDNWDFLCFTKTLLLDTLIKSNIPNKLIIDYDYQTSTSGNGIEFLKAIINKNPIFKNMLVMKQIYIIANKNQFIELHQDKSEYDFSIIQKPLTMKDISTNLLYH